MQNQFGILRRLLLSAIVLLLIFAALQQATPAQLPTQLNSRLSRLEVEVRSLRSDIRQLASQVSGVSRIPTARRPVSPPVTRPDVFEPSLEEQFDNLAILAIELKQRVVELENRVNQLELQLSPQ
ncbi:MAG: hypothetical protein MJA27_01815 [Pseudanabaenales cyanobacterium]|nr:hypothetical protein [Pseudanabaenales cyanobacterium]